MKYILVLTVFAAISLACANSPQPAPPSPPAPEATSEAAPTPSDASNVDVSGLYIFQEGDEEQLPPRRILPVFPPRPLDEEACEIYGSTDDEGVLKILAPGDPGYKMRVELTITALNVAARDSEGTPSPMLEEEIARLPYLIDCLERARE